MLGWKLHVGQHVGLRLIHEYRQLGNTRAGMVGNLTPLLAGGVGIVLSECGADPRRDNSPLGLTSIGQGVAHEVNSGAVEKAFRL